MVLFKIVQADNGERFWNFKITYFTLHKLIWTLLYMGFPGGSDDKESACNAGDPGSIPGWGRSPGERNVYSL